MVYRDDSSGYSLNASLFSRYEMVIQDLSQRGLKKFFLGSEATVRATTVNETVSRYIDMEIILDTHDKIRVLRTPLYGALNHHLPMDDETEARVRYENEKLQEMLQQGRLPVTYGVDRLVQNDDNQAIDRLRRILKAGAYVSQLAVVSSKTSLRRDQSPRFSPIYPVIRSQRPYKDISDIDTYLDETLGPITGSSLVSNS